VKQEGILEKLAPIVPSDQVVPASFPGNTYVVGTGLHDSSASLIPYLVSFHEPFVLISTGTWSISLNPFNDSPLTVDELANDCLCYMQYQGKPVKASRLFAGYEHDQQVKRIASHFNQNPARYRSMPFNPEIISTIRKKDEGQSLQAHHTPGEFRFAKRSLDGFANDEEAYHQLIFDLVTEQYISTQFVLKGTKVKRIFVDGGFSKNTVFMNLLASFFPGMEVYAASMAQATAVGTALAIHRAWNDHPLPNDIIELKYYAVTHDLEI
jgi:sugar (pentulose or hexulose) kinase